MNDLFWVKWAIEQKRLKRSQPKCRCGKKGKSKSQPQDAYHHADCPFLMFWDDKFLNFWKRVTYRHTLRKYLGFALK